jgi:methionine-rich copper-binding protein CopC
MRTLQHAPKSRCCSAAFKALSVVVLGVILAATLAVPAAAHTGFESSSPAQGESIDEPVGEIKIVFTGAAEPSGEGFVILDPTGAVREPASAVSVDSLTWTLTFSEPLAGGTTGVR